MPIENAKIKINGINGDLEMYIQVKLEKLIKILNY